MTEYEILQKINLLLEFEISNEFILRKKVLTVKLADNTTARIKVKKLDKGSNNK